MIFLDMDGVLADFDAHYKFYTGGAPTRWPEPDNVDWSRVNSIPYFYETVPVMAGARELVDTVVLYCVYYGLPKPRILTGIPSSVNMADNQKTRWAHRNFPGIRVTCCPARDKYKHGAYGDVLIDDYLRYRDAWVDMGGVFVHHTDTPSTLVKLRELGICTPSSQELLSPPG